MGRFYADLDRIQHDKLLKQSRDVKFTTLIELHMMSSSDTLSRKQPNLPTDRDGDIIMTETISTSPPVSPFKEKFSFEWFSFDGSKHSSAKAPLFPPISPASPTARKLSVSTASPSSYFSDLSPTTLDLTSKTKASDLVNSRRLRVSQLVLPSPPNPPLNWIWQCHLCRSRYPLSVTRRCLIDGHYYCSGVTTTTQRNVKRRKANRSCSSEFDYIGWQDWGRWTRKCKSLKAYAASKENGPILQGCEGCSFPSQCRYENRPRQEVLEFSEFIDEKDIDTLMVDEVEELVSPEKQAFEEELLTRPSNSPKSVSEKARKTTRSSQVLKEAALVPKLETPDTTDSAPEKLTLSKRQRIYSGIANTISSVNTSSARDNSEKGKFDPTLPSVSASSTTSGSEVDSDESQGYLDIIEATLRSALPLPSPATQHGTRRSQSLSQISTLPNKAKIRKRLNSKIDDPEFEVLADDARCLTSIKDTSNPSRPGSGLTRTNSEQSLITDLFRQVKSSSRGTAKDKIVDEKAKRAANEADIAEFLQLPKRTATSPRITTPKSISVGPLKTGKPPQHFEEIHLTPKETKSGNVFLEILTPSVGISDGGGKTNSDPIKQDPEPPEESPKGDVVGKGVATGLTGGLFNFGFGRK